MSASAARGSCLQRGHKLRFGVPGGRNRRSDPHCETQAAQGNSLALADGVLQTFPKAPGFAGGVVTDSLEVDNVDSAPALARVEI